MKIGITGHQERPGIDWDWVRSTIEMELAGVKEPLYGLSSLAKGADQIFGQAVLDQGGQLFAILPLDGYDRHFDGPDLAKYRALLSQSTVTQLRGRADDETAFLRAGLYIVDHCEQLIAVWDGEPAQGKGGTADIVMHAHHSSKPWLHIEPLTKTLIRYPGAF